MEYFSRVFPDLREKVLDLVKTQYPEVYEKLNLEETSLISLLINIQTFLTETQLYHLAQSLKEIYPGTAQLYESILWHAYSAGYKPAFAVPSNAVVELVIPIQNLNTGERILDQFGFDIDFETELYGTHLDGLQLVNFKPKYRYQLRFNGFNGIIYRIDRLNQQDVVNYRRLTYSFAGQQYDCIGIPIEVEQIDQVVEFNEIVGDTSIYDFYTIELPVKLEDFKNIAEIEVYVGDEKADYQPVVLLFEPDKYQYTIRFGEVPSILLSNGTFGKKVLTGSNVKIILKYTSGSDGVIRENSLLFKSTPVNVYDGSGINLYAFLHGVIANGLKSELPESIRRNVVRTIRTNERLVTAQDYNDLISRDFPDVFSFTYSRTTDLNVNEAAVYLGILKSKNPETLDYDFFKTDTKALILTLNELNTASYIKHIGGNYVIPSGLVYGEDTAFHYSGHYCRVDSALDLNSLPTDCSGLWVPLFTYEIDMTTFEMKTIFNPVNYSYTATITKNEAIYQGMIIDTDVSPLTLNLVVTPTSLEYEVSLTVTLTFGGNLSNFNLLTTNPVETWLQVNLNDPTAGLSIDFNSSTTLTVLSVGTNSIVVKCTNRIPYSSVNPILYNFDLNVQFKLPSESAFTHSILTGIYRGVYFKYDFTDYSFSKLQFRNYDVSCGSYYGYSSDDYLIIHDIPVVSLYEIRDETPEVLTFNLFKVFEQISIYCSRRSITAVTNNVLLARTFGFSYVYRYTAGDPTAYLELPLQIELNVKLDNTVPALTTASTIQENLKRYINESAGFTAGVAHVNLYKIVSDVEGVLSANIIKPSSDLIFKIKSLEDLPVCEFRAFVPELYYTKNNLITVNVV